MFTLRQQLLIFSPALTLDSLVKMTSVLSLMNVESWNYLNMLLGGTTFGVYRKLKTLQCSGELQSRVIIPRNSMEQPFIDYRLIFPLLINNIDYCGFKHSTVDSKYFLATRTKKGFLHLGDLKQTKQVILEVETLSIFTKCAHK